MEIFKNTENKENSVIKPGVLLLRLPGYPVLSQLCLTYAPAWSSSQWAALNPISGAIYLSACILTEL